MLWHEETHRSFPRCSPYFRVKGLLYSISPTGCIMLWCFVRQSCEIKYLLAAVDSEFCSREKQSSGQKHIAAVQRLNCQKWCAAAITGARLPSKHTFHPRIYPPSTLRQQFVTICCGIPPESSMSLDSHALGRRSCACESASNS